MISRRTYHFLITVFSVLFVSLQGAALAHATHFGEAPHEHDGIVCVVDAIAAEENIVLPPPVATATAFIYISSSYEETFVSTTYATPQGRAPPPRGPPA